MSASSGTLTMSTTVTANWTAATGVASMPARRSAAQASRSTIDQKNGSNGPMGRWMSLPSAARLSVNRGPNAAPVRAAS